MKEGAGALRKSYQSNKKHREIDGGHNQEDAFKAGKFIFALNLRERGNCAIMLNVDFSRRGGSRLVCGCGHRNRG